MKCGRPDLVDKQPRYIICLTECKPEKVKIYHD